MDGLFLVVGLGNPGPEYAATRHNIGFMAVEHFGARHGARWADENRFQARLARIELGTAKVLVSQPLTFMNDSGTAVRGLFDFFKLEVARVLVVSDDADLPLGEIRLRASGGTGGHHGLESVERMLASRNYARLRVGIGRQAAGGKREITGHVLSDFAAAERLPLASVLDRVARQMECWITSGIGKAMNEFNGGEDLSEQKEAE